MTLQIDFFERKGKCTCMHSQETKSYTQANLMPPIAIWRHSPELLGSMKTPYSGRAVHK